MRIGLVLGAGGAVGVAYHGAVLATIEEVTGWDPRDADLIVGTSAGALTAALLRAGVPASDLPRISEDLPLSDEGSRLAAIGRPHRPRPKAADLLGIRPIAEPAAFVHALAHPRSHSFGALVVALMPSGPVPTDALSAGTDLVFAGSWPSRPLWLCAVSLREGRRVVFGQEGAPAATVGQAVAASCAIPGYFKPVCVGGRRYVDGGVHSHANLDLAAQMDLDLVIVSSPMTHTGSLPPVAGAGVVRAPLRAQLHAEIASLRRRGVSVVAVEPDRKVAAAMGFNPMDARHRGPVSRAARAETAAWLGDRMEGRWLVAMLSVATSAARAAGRQVDIDLREAPPAAAEAAVVTTDAFASKSSA